MKRRDDGFVLLCVLWVVVILTLVTVSFGRQAMLERRAASYAIDHEQALNMARGAVERGIVELRNKAAYDRIQKPMSQASYTGFDQEWNHPPSLTDEGTLKVDEAGSHDEVKYIIRDEQSRISVNLAPKELLSNVKELGVRGAEEMVSLRTVPADAKTKSAFVLLEQVRDLDGVDQSAWEGKNDKAGLRDLLTCWGDGRINLNTARREVLEQIPELDKGVLDAVMLYRNGLDGEECTNDDQAFETWRDVLDKAQISGDVLGPLAKYCTLDSQFFTITGLATQRQGRIRAICEATVEVRNGESRICQWREDPSGS